MNFFCKDCRVVAGEASLQSCSSIVRKNQPLKLRLLGLLGLLQPLIHRFVLNKQRSSYQFSRKHLLFLERENCSIPVLHFPLTSPEKSTVLVYSHGNGSDLNHIYGMARKLFELYSVAVVAYDYTGYGESGRQKGNFEEDIKTVLAWVLSKGYAAGRVVLMGFSLGSYPTLVLEAPIPRVLIAPISGLTSFVEGEIAHYENEPFDNIQAARRLNCRVFMVHSTDDTVSIEHSRVLYQALTEGKDFNSQSKIRYIETNGLKHDQMPNFFSRRFIYVSSVGKQIVQPVPSGSQEGPRSR